jgi:3,4-dihydroxy 2-butanone 4-phosphate synthase/GTP cyclohydrolase II
MSNLNKALADFKAGKFVIVTDDETRENEGDLFILGACVTAAQMGFMVRYTSGVICAAMTEAVAKQFELPFMVKRNQDSKQTAFTISIDAKPGLTTGISASERATTLNMLADSKALSTDFVRPGHIFPLVANNGGLNVRRGHTEAAVVMAAAVNATPVVAISELVNDDGSMMRGDALFDFAKNHDIEIITIEELAKEFSNINFESSKEIRWARLPRETGDWQIGIYKNNFGIEHAVLKFGSESQKQPLIRMHSECLTGDALGSARCDCGEQLNKAFAEIENHGYGYILYMRDHEGRGIGLAAKIEAYILQDAGFDTVDANLKLGHEIDQREWQDAADILQLLGINKLELLTNNPEKVAKLKGFGFAVTRAEIKGTVNPNNEFYLKTKQERLKHELGI